MRTPWDRQERLSARAAGDVENLTGDETAVFACKEGHRGGDILIATSPRNLGIRVPSTIMPSLITISNSVTGPPNRARN